MNEQLANPTDMQAALNRGLAIMRIENESLQQIAVTRPRDEGKVFKKATDELNEFPEFAAKAFYVIPYKDKAEDGSVRTVEVTGPSIVAARSIARFWGNCAVRVIIAGDTEKEIILDGAVIDFETGFRDSRQMKVSKNRWDKANKQMVPLREDKLVQSMGANASKLERNLILSIIPIHVTQRYYRLAMQLASGAKKSKGVPAVPLNKRTDAMFGRFAELNVPRETILAYLKVGEAKEITEDMLGRLIGIFNAINDRETTIEQAFGIAKEQARDEEAQGRVEQLMGGGEATGSAAQEELLPEQEKTAQEVRTIEAMITNAKSEKSLQAILGRIMDKTQGKVLSDKQSQVLTGKVDVRQNELRQQAHQ